MASQKQLENKYKQAQTTADDWYRRAQLALEKGEEELAREALQRRKQYQDNADSLKGQLDTQAGTVEKLIQNTRVLETKLSEAKSKKDTLKARAASARTQQKVNEIAGGISTTSAAAAFDKMEEKVMGMEAQADAVAQISTDDLDSKFAALGTHRPPCSQAVAEKRTERRDGHHPWVGRAPREGEGALAEPCVRPYRGRLGGRRAEEDEGRAQGLLHQGLSARGSRCEGGHRPHRRRAGGPAEEGEGHVGDRGRNLPPCGAPRATCDRISGRAPGLCLPPTRRWYMV
eukprot:scaffold549_cov385-Prasinococcus_capsulatus_cf.AAC.23